MNFENLTPKIEKTPGSHKPGRGKKKGRISPTSEEAKAIVERIDPETGAPLTKEEVRERKTRWVDNPEGWRDQK